MTLPEWLAIIVVTIVAGVISWGVKRLVKANDDSALALAGINVNLAAMNGRLALSEQWQDSHEKKDDERHDEMKENHKAMWKVIESIRA